MRDIKFRQWIGERFHYWGFMNDSRIGPIEVWGQYADSEQYTGLKDKNGKEIYEGDICNISQIGISSMDDPDPFTRVIKWDDERAGFCQLRINGQEGGSGWSFCQNAVGKYYTVMGNIHENPGLLKQDEKA